MKLEMGSEILFRDRDDSIRAGYINRIEITREDNGELEYKFTVVTKK